MFLLTRIFERRAPRPDRAARRTRTARLFLELLEDRIAPAALGNPIVKLSDPAGKTLDLFGNSVALAGSLALVGAPGTNSLNGAAYQFNTAGILTNTYTPSGSGTGNALGFSVAASPTRAVAGAPGFSLEVLSGFISPGYMQSLYNNGVTNDPSQGLYDGFGCAVALSSQYLLVGASGANGNQGAAFLFDASGHHEQVLSDPGNNTGDAFGSSVAVSDQYVLVSAPGAHGGAGAAYLFDTSGNLLQTFNDPNGAPSDGFGSAVAISGDDFAVGVPYVSGGTGAVYLVDAAGNLLQTLTSPGQYQFGIALAAAASGLLVGASGGAGAADLYDSAGNLVQSFSNPDQVDYENYGLAVALSDSNVLIGASGEDNEAGAAYLYNLAAAMTALAGSQQTTPVGTAFGTLLETQVIDAQGDPVAGANVVFTVNSGGAGATFPGGGTTVAVPTNAEGLAYAPPLTANGTAGAFTVTASVGSFRSTFSLTNTAGPPASIAVAGGSAQYGIIGIPYTLPLQALVTDADGNPVPGILVTFAAPTTGSSGVFAGVATALTDGRGIATAPALIPNHGRGAFQVTATAPGVAAPADFTLTNLAVPATLTPAGGGQTAVVYHAFAKRLSVTVRDASGQPIPDLPVDFEVVAGNSGAHGDFTGSVILQTDATGVATAPALIASSTPGPFTVEAWVMGQALPVLFTLTNAVGAAASFVTHGGTPQSTAVGTPFAAALAVRYTDANGQPVTNVPVTFTVVPAGGAGAGFGPKKSLTATATTDANGIATAPALTANGTAGSYTVTAAALGISTPATFKLGNTAVPAKIAAVVGTTPQTAKSSQPFATDLAVLVLDSNGHPISGVVVTFALPPATASSAGGSFAGSAGSVSVSTTSTGKATAPTLTANAIAGSFTVTATIAGLSSVVSFELTID